MIRRLLFLLVFLLLSFEGIANAQNASPALRIRVAATPGDEVTPLIYAQSAGLFAKAGLDVQLERLASGSAIAAAVAGGAVDIGKSSLLPIINAHDHGVPFRLISPGLLWISGSPTAGMVTLTGTPIGSGKDLAGKTLSTNALKDLGEISIRSWVDATGGDSRTVKFVEVPSAAVVAALDAGRVYAGNLVDPQLSTSLATGKIKVAARSEDAIAKRFLTTAWFADAGYIEKNRAAIQAFEQVMIAATQYTNAHEAEMVPLIAPFWSMSPDVLAKMNRGTNALTLLASDIQPLIDAAAKYGAISKRFDANELISPLALKPQR
jgi:NitT/TauT family transport system substrate-binding protein